MLISSWYGKSLSRLGLGRSFSSGNHRPEFSIGEILAEKNKARCIERMGKMSSLRPTLSGQPLRKKAAVLVPIVQVEDEAALLYTKRSIYLTNHRGQVSFPGGNADDNESPETTALRETYEEIGVVGDKVEVWGTMPGLASNHQGDYIAIPVVGFVHGFDINRLTLNEREVSEVFCIKFSQLANPRLHGYTQFRAKPKGYPGYSLPVFTGPPHVVWGLTAIMTFQLLKSLLPSSLYRHKIYFQSPLNKL